MIYEETKHDNFSFNKVTSNFLDLVLFFFHFFAILNVESKRIGAFSFRNVKFDRSITKFK